MSDDTDVTPADGAEAPPDVSVGGEFEPEHWTADNGQPQETQFPDDGLLQVVADERDDDFDTVLIHYPDGSTETHDRPEVVEDDDYDEAGGLMGASEWVSTSVPRPPLWTPSQAVAQDRYQVNHHTCPHYRTYGGLCLHLCACMYGWGSSGMYDAISQWRLTPEKYCHYNRDIPKGALVFWASGAGGSGHGHIAVAIGGGQIASNDVRRYGRVDLVDVSFPERYWGQHYKGWSPPYFYRGNGTNGQRPVGGSATTEKAADDWSKGPVYVSRLRYRQDDSDSVRRLKYRIKRTDFIPKRLRDELDPDNGYYGHHLRDAVAYWQAHRPGASKRADNDGRSLSGHEANAIFGDRYTVHHDAG